MFQFFQWWEGGGRGGGGKKKKGFFPAWSLQTLYSYLDSSWKVFHRRPKKKKTGKGKRGGKARAIASGFIRKFQHRLVRQRFVCLSRKKKRKKGGGGKTERVVFQRGCSKGNN